MLSRVYKYCDAFCEEVWAKRATAERKKRGKSNRMQERLA